MLRFRFSAARLSPAIIWCACAFALASTAAAQGKVGVVNFQKAVLDSAEAKKANADLQAEFKPQADELEKLQRMLQDDQTTLQNSQGKLSPQREAELNGNITIEQHKAERLQQDLQDDVQKKRDETIQRLGTRMTEVIAMLRDSKGLDIVIDTAAAIAFNKTIDLTAEATAAYDKAYPVK